MKPAWRPLLEQTVPRYTSYPSALQFSDAVGPADRDTALLDVGQYEAISLYVHVPFCAQLCWYCGCNMRVETKYQRTAAYRQALLDEISDTAARLAGRGCVTQVHFGGGTPNYFKSADLERILEAIEIGFGLTDTTPVAMEIDPRLCSERQISDLAALGVHRVSLGVQDFDPFVQAAINRIQSFELIEACTSQFREAGIADIGFDLLYGLPRQKLCTFRESVRKTIALGPDRISLFGYAHIPNRLRHQQLIEARDLPSPTLRADLAEMAGEMLMGAGYFAVGFDHFARPDTPLAKAQSAGRLFRNFQGFTEDPATSIIGFGASAISTFPALHVQNEKSLTGYQQLIASVGGATVRGAVVTDHDQVIGRWIMSFLCAGKGHVGALLGEDAGAKIDAPALLQNLAAFRSAGLIDFDEEWVTMRPEARSFARLVVSSFDPYVGQGVHFASQAV